MQRWSVPAGSAGWWVGAAVLFGTLREATAQDDWDFGDAPDAPYPTLAASNGARHKIVPGAPWLGDPTDGPDAEPDGQPDPNALGDDNDGNDDEDGIAILGPSPSFPNALVVGIPGTIRVDVGGPGGRLDAWVDWNRNGAWEPGERIFGNMVPGGPLLINVTPPGPQTGLTFARFRIHSGGAPLQPTGPADDGEVEDHALWILSKTHEGAKWEQPPDLSREGFDVETRRFGDPPILLADDFLCTERSTLTNIVVWGSWLGDKYPLGLNGPDPSLVEFTLSIHADVPAGVNAPWSMPGKVLWWTNFPAGSFITDMEATNIEEGWYDPSTTNYMPNADWTCWRYTFPILPQDAFVQTGSVDNAVVYWLDVQAHVLDDNPNVRFGWKTTVPDARWNDDACWAPAVEPHDGFWWEMRYPPNHPLNLEPYNSFDLAFRLDG